MKLPLCRMGRHFQLNSAGCAGEHLHQLGGAHLQRREPSDLVQPVYVDRGRICPLKAAEAAPSQAGHLLKQGAYGKVKIHKESKVRQLMHPLEVAAALELKFGGALTVVADITEEMGVGMASYIARDLREGTEDKADYDRYCHLVAGTVGEGLTRLFVAVGYEDPALVGEYNLWNDMGLFLQNTNIIRDYLEDLVDGRAFWPRTVYSKHVDELADMRLDTPSPAAELAARTCRGLACLDEMVAEALELTPPHCLDYLDRLSNLDVLRFCAVPQV